MARFIRLAAGSLALALSAGTGAVPPAPAETDNGWPRTFSNHEQITVYEPDIESWSANRISQRAAVSVLRPASSEPSYGVIWFTARTEVDRGSHVVTLEDTKITRASFPTEQGKTDELLSILRLSLPGLVKEISLDRLQANLAVTQAESKQRAPELAQTPPRVFYSRRPAVLVLIDGQPALRQSGSRGILRVMNTRSVLLLDQSSGIYYLFLGNRWMRAPSSNGPWTLASSHPRALDTVKQSLSEQKLVDLMNDPGSPLMQMLSQGTTPTVYVSDEPAELIQTSGPPSLKPISGTPLLYVDNTPDNIFLDSTSSGYYVLISGRWYRSGRLEGPWKAVPQKALPAAFASIPEAHPKATVLASVEGTSQAQEAGIANSIPQTATVNRADTTFAVAYDGSPRFEPISGTSLLYAVNSAVPVIEVSPEQFYSVQNGIWFVASSPNGPWTVATSVPAIIYSIPPNSPLYYVTFVRVYGYTPEVVYVGYTPGYFGSFLGADGVVVFGTGYYYPPWIGGVWYGWPVSFGFGFSVGVGGGVAVGAVVAPWWGPWRVWHGTNFYRANVYRVWPHQMVRNSWDQHETANRVPLRTSRSNSLYSTRSGSVYRYGSHGWEEHAPEGWRSSTTRPDELERSREARGIGENRWSGFRSGAPSAMPAPRAGIAPPRYSGGGGGGYQRGGSGGRGAGRR